MFKSAQSCEDSKQKLPRLRSAIALACSIPCRNACVLFTRGSEKCSCGDTRMAQIVNVKQPSRWNSQHFPHETVQYHRCAQRTVEVFHLSSDGSNNGHPIKRLRLMRNEREKTEAKIRLRQACLQQNSNVVGQQRNIQESFECFAAVRSLPCGLASNHKAETNTVLYGHYILYCFANSNVLIKSPLRFRVMRGGEIVLFFLGGGAHLH